MSIFLNKFGFVKAEPEATYGTHPATGNDSNDAGTANITILSDFDAVYVEEFEATEDYDPIQRAGKSKERPGWAPQTGLITPTFTGAVELRPAQMYKFQMDENYAVPAGAPDRHALPGGALWLLSCGFRIATEALFNQEGDDGSGVDPAADAVLTMVPDVFSAPSITVENYTRKYQGSESEAYMRQVMTGCRADGTLSVRAGERLMLNLDGGAKDYDLLDYVPRFAFDDPVNPPGGERKVLPVYTDDGVSANGASNNPAPEFRQPFVGLNATCTLSYTDAEGTFYELGTGINPANLLSLEIPFNNGLTYPRTMSEDGSVSEVILAPTDNMGFSMMLEADDIAVWDIQELVRQKYLMNFTVRLTDRETNRDYIEISGVVALANAEFAEEDERLVWNCTGSIVYENQGDPYTSGSPLLKIQWVTPYT